MGLHVIMEKKMETTILQWSIYWGYIVFSPNKGTPV